MSENDKQQNVSLSKQDLIDIVKAATAGNAELIKEAVSAAIKTAKEPTVLEQRQIDAENELIKAKQASRAKTAKGVKEEIKNKRWIHENCSHEHTNGTSHCVYVQEPFGPGYIICQKNQCVIRSGEAGPNYKGRSIFNTALFNKIFQKLNQSGEIFG